MGPSKSKIKISRDIFGYFDEERVFFARSLALAPSRLVQYRQFSATSMESSRRDPLHNVADQRSILKNDQITYYPRFGFTPKTGVDSSKQVSRFLMCNLRNWKF